MKFCMVLEFFVPHYNGGGEHRYHEIAKRLVERGHHVDLLTMKVENVPDYENIDGIHVHHIGPIVRNPPIRSSLDFMKYFFSVSRWFLSHKYDIIDAQAYSPLLSAKFMSMLTKTPIIGTIHDTSSSSNDQWLQSSKVAGFMEKFLVNLGYDKIITVSHATKNSLINDFGVKGDIIEILYNGVDIARYDSVNVDETVENRLIFVGRLAPHKHVDHLIRIMPELLEQIPSANLIIVGKGEEKERLTNLIHEYNLENFIVFKQDLSDEELIIEIKKSELLILPSTREGFGMVLAEANCCNKPVITYASGGTVEVVEDNYNGFLIKQEDIEMLTMKIEEVLTDELVKERLGNNGRQKVEQDFDWEKIVDTYINIVEKIL